MTKPNSAIIFGSTSTLGNEIAHALENKFELNRFSSQVQKTIDTHFSYSSITEESLSKIHPKLEDNDLIIFNQASTKIGSLENLDQSSIIQAFMVNAVFPLEVIKYILRRTIRFHRFIFISSIAGSFRSETASVAYSSSKRAIHGIVKHLAYEKGEHADFIAIAPSQMLTDSLVNNLSPEQIASLMEKNPTRKLCTTDEVSSIISFISSYQGRHLNGSILDINGGII